MSFYFTTYNSDIMNCLATLRIDDAKFMVTKCKFGVRQTPATTKIATEDPTYDLIEIEVISNGDSLLFNWYASTEKKNDGSISFYKNKDTLCLFKKVDFFNGYCLSYDEYFEDKYPMKTRVTIYATKVTIEEEFTVSSN